MFWRLIAPSTAQGHLRALLVLVIKFSFALMINDLRSRLDVQHQVSISPLLLREKCPHKHDGECGGCPKGQSVPSELLVSKPHNPRFPLDRVTSVTRSHKMDRRSLGADTSCRQRSEGQSLSSTFVVVCISHTLLSQWEFLTWKSRIAFPQGKPAATVALPNPN